MLDLLLGALAISFSAVFMKMDAVGPTAAVDKAWIRLSTHLRSSVHMSSVLIIFSFNDAKNLFVWRGFTLKWYPELLGDRDLMHGLSVTVQVAAIAVVVTTALGSLLGLGLARLRSGASAGAADTLILLPMVTPEVVMGISLLLFFSLLFNANGSIWQIAIAHIAFSISYVAIIVRARAVSLDPRMEEAARDLGATPVSAFFHVTLPLLAPAVAAGALC